MLNLKNIPIGIDTPIQGFQEFIYGQLKSLWGVSDSEYDSFGRCYRNMTDAGYIPEVFVSSDQVNNTVYKEVWFDDSLHKVVSFFDVAAITKYDKGSSVATVNLIFIVNVPLLKPDIQHRGDEEIRRDIEQLCASPRFNFTMKSFVTGFKNVFANFDGYLKRDQITFRDLHPLHVFSIGFDLLYNINDC